MELKNIKKNYGVLISIIIVIIFAIFIFASTKSKPSIDKNVQDILYYGGKLPDDICEYFGFKGKNVILESHTCPHCINQKETVTKPLEKEGYHFIYYDILNEEDLAYLESKGIYIQGTPTNIINCNVVVGELNKDQMLSLLKKSGVNNAN